MGVIVNHNMSKTKPIYDVVCGIIHRRNRVLITQRPNGAYYSGYWEFPGGKVERGESGEAGLARELLEELGIYICDVKFWRVDEYAYPDRYVKLHFYFCKIKKGSPRPIGCSNIKWVRYSDLAGYPFPPADIPLLKELLETPTHRFHSLVA